MMASKYIRKPVPIPLEIRGLSRTPLDEAPHPIDSIKDIDLFERTCGHNLQKALKSHQATPCSSGRSSPTIQDTQSPLSVSQGGWTTGNTTERSSLDSSYSLADFDKQAANTVTQHFEEFEAALYEGQSPASFSAPPPGHAPFHPGITPAASTFVDVAPSSSPQSDLARECREWCAQFPHLRVLGKQACPIKDLGFSHVPSTDQSATGSRPTSSSLLLEVTDHDISMSSDSQGLSLTGHSVSARRAPKEALLASERDSSASAYSFLVEEVIAEDGLYEDIIAVDYKNIYEDNIEHKQQITPRRRRVGFPPVTPNACVKDSVTSGAFDHIWQEIMSWMRPLLKRYTSEITDSKHDDVTPFSLHHPTRSTPITRDFSFIRQHGGSLSMQRSHTHVGSSTDRSIDGILQISSMPLQNRNQMLDTSDSPALISPVRPGSSLQSGHQPRPMSHLRASGGHARTGTRAGRLAPLPRAVNTDEDKSNRHAAIDALRVRGRTPMSNDLIPTSASFTRNGALPPLEIERRKPFPSYRATSAIDNKDTRLLPFRDRPHLLAEQARPNTTHAMRSETPYGNSLNRRSSTPLGNTITARNTLLANKSLDVRGNSLQPGDAGHFHPDIQEDQQEGPGEEFIRTHWRDVTQPSHGMNPRRNRVTLK